MPRPTPRPPAPLDRRAFLRRSSLPVASLLVAPALAPFAPIALGSPVAPARRDDPGDALDFEAFVALAREAVGRLADELREHASPEAEARYLHALAACAVRLRDVPVPPLRETTPAGVSARRWLGANDADVPFTVLHWKLDPGARIEPHAHTYGNVVTLCLEGEARVENWEAVEAPRFDSSERCVVRRVVDQQLLPGAINLVPLHRGYVHGFVAGPAGARGLDLTTRIAQKRWNPVLHVEGEPIDAARSLHCARWSLA